jgi:hypothetical protein
VTGLAWEHRKRLAIKEIVAGATLPRAATFVAARARMVELTAGSAIGLLVGNKGQLLITGTMERIAWRSAMKSERGVVL